MAQGRWPSPRRRGVAALLVHSLAGLQPAPAGQRARLRLAAGPVRRAPRDDAAGARRPRGGARGVCRLRAARRGRRLARRRGAGLQVAPPPCASRQLRLGGVGRRAGAPSLPGRSLARARARSGGATGRRDGPIPLAPRRAPSTTCAGRWRCGRAGPRRGPTWAGSSPRAAMRPARARPSTWRTPLDPTHLACARRAPPSWPPAKGAPASKIPAAMPSAETHRPGRGHPLASSEDVAGAGGGRGRVALFAWVLRGCRHRRRPGGAGQGGSVLPLALVPSLILTRPGGGGRLLAIRGIGARAPLRGLIPARLAGMPWPEPALGPGAGGGAPTVPSPWAVRPALPGRHGGPGRAQAVRHREPWALPGPGGRRGATPRSRAPRSGCSTARCCRDCC